MRDWSFRAAVTNQSYGAVETEHTRSGAPTLLGRVDSRSWETAIISRARCSLPLLLRLRIPLSQLWARGPRTCDFHHTPA